MINKFNLDDLFFTFGEHFNHSSGLTSKIKSTSLVEGTHLMEMYDQPRARK